MSNIKLTPKSKSGIHIKKENKGKFTKYCNGKVTSECIARGKNSSDPAVRKRATFAANARKWKHEEGSKIHKPFGHNLDNVVVNGWIASHEREVRKNHKLVSKNSGGRNINAPTKQEYILQGLDKLSKEYNAKYESVSSHKNGGLLIQKFLNAGNLPRRVDFYTYKPLKDRKFIASYMELLQDSLIARNMDEPLRFAMMASVLHESGGDPKAKNNTGKYQGIIQWGPGRFPGSFNLGDLIHNLLETSNNVSSPNWTHGGSGIPYTRDAQSAYDGYVNATNAYDAALYYNKGYVRPKEEQSRINRAEEAENMSKVAK